MGNENPAPWANRLPKFFEVAGDPCGDQNPFPAADPRHEPWRRATRTAEEWIAKLTELMPEAYSVRLKNESNRVESELAEYGRPLNTISMAPLLVPFYRGKFDIWAWRGLAGILSDEDLPIYDSWLDRFAQSWLELIDSSNYPEEHTRPLITELQTKLMEGIAHWHCQARQCLRSLQQVPTHPTAMRGAGTRAELQKPFEAGDAPQAANSLEPPFNTGSLGCEPVEKGSGHPNGWPDEGMPGDRQRESAGSKTPKRRRGPAADDEGHKRVANLLPKSWKQDVRASLGLLDPAADGEPRILPSPAWCKKYKITGYSDVYEAIGENEIRQHLARRRARGRELLALQERPRQ